MSVTVQQKRVYYESCLVGLRALELRDGRSRRFGADADTRWAGFRGHLGTAARLDLLVRDAAVTWGAAFSPAAIFQLPGLAADEPFGPDWHGLPEHIVEQVWKAETGDSLDAAAGILGIEGGAIDVGPVPANRRIVVAGGRALRAVADVFAADESISWPEQVLVVAVRPNVRHFAGLVAPLIGASGPTALIVPSDDPTKAVRDAGFAGATPLSSPDADPEARAFVDALPGGA